MESREEWEARIRAERLARIKKMNEKRVAPHACRWCGKVFERDRVFCTDECRSAWRASRPYVTRPAVKGDGKRSRARPWAWKRVEDKPADS